MDGREIKGAVAGEEPMLHGIEGHWAYASQRGIESYRVDDVRLVACGPL